MTTVLDRITFLNAPHGADKEKDVDLTGTARAVMVEKPDGRDYVKVSKGRAPNWPQDVRYIIGSAGGDIILRTAVYGYDKRTNMAGSFVYFYTEPP